MPITVKLQPQVNLRFWEDFRHGLFLGSKKFVERIRGRYLPTEPLTEMPQKKHKEITKKSVYYTANRGLVATNPRFIVQ